jgi:hypothetical protein
MIERVYVINLPHRTERLAAFWQRFPKDWHFPTPLVFSGIDGKLVPPPAWWQGGPGGWGCHRSHTRLLEDCLKEGINSVMVCEDDAVFVDHFTEKVKLYFQHLPQDWRIAYIGGQHIQQEQRLPRKVNDWVYQPYNINRNHCFVLHGRDAMELYFRHLTNYPDWKLPHHTDHRLGELHKTSPRGLYCPREWLAGQSEGYSDICFKELELRLFTGAEALCYPQITLNGIAIIGTFGSGTSCITGALSYLGISIGSHLPKKNDTKIHCPFEDGILGGYCRRAYTEPWMEENTTEIDRTNHLRHWAGIQCQNPQNTSSYFAGKHAILSLMGKELLEAWNDPYFICIDRPIDECCHTIEQARWGWHPRAVKQTIDFQLQSRDRFLEEYSPRFLRVSFKRFLLSPEKSLREICDFIGYTPTEQQVKDALQFLAEQQSTQHPYL